MTATDKFKKYSRKGVSIIKNEGILSLGIKSLQKLQKRQQQQSSNVKIKKKFDSLVDRESVMAADWSNFPYKKPTTKTKAPYTINWVMSPPAGGGGHQNIFRFIEILDKAGHTNNVYLYSVYDDMTIEQAAKNVSTYCKADNLTFRKYDGTMVESDALFATGWETAYPVFNQQTIAQKFYFVQDFEPLFYPMGTNYILAENTYRFGFHGITAGGWLDKTLTDAYGMSCDHYDFGADKTKYTITNNKKRKEVFFYARPVTDRRGFDLGLMALELFHKQMPEYKINFAGWDVSEWDVPFPYVNHGAMQIDELPDLYNKCAVALVPSLTNMSLMPLELLAAGTIPVVNDMPNNRLVSNNKYIAYTESSPAALAQKMVEAVTRVNQPEYARKASDSVSTTGWEDAGKKFLSVLERELS
jgi:glycosyltransferase involved in cell wall biosynthesis